MQLCCFELDGTRYGLDINAVREVNRALEIDAIPHAPKHARGYMNIRGQIHLIVDLRVYMGLEPGDLTPESRVIVFTPKIEQAFGVLVDRVQDIVDVDEARIHWREHTSDAHARPGSVPAELIAGDCRMDRQLIMVIDPHRVVSET